MKAHLRYLSYVLRHKGHVLYAGLKLGVPLWQLLVHDLSKFSPAEWGPYVQRFYGPNAKPRDTGQGYYHEQGEDPAFDEAWRHHWTRNSHHWQHWCSPEADDGTRQAKPMPDHYVREMVADWYGAGMAQGKPNIAGWYDENQHKMVLHPDARAAVIAYLSLLEFRTRSELGRG